MVTKLWIVSSECSTIIQYAEEKNAAYDFARYSFRYSFLDDFLDIIDPRATPNSVNIPLTIRLIASDGIFKIIHLLSFSSISQQAEDKQARVVTGAG